MTKKLKTKTFDLRFLAEERHTVQKQHYFLISQKLIRAKIQRIFCTLMLQIFLQDLKELKNLSFVLQCCWSATNWIEKSLIVG